MAKSTKPEVQAEELNTPETAPEVIETPAVEAEAAVEEVAVAEEAPATEKKASKRTTKKEVVAQMSEDEEGDDEELVLEAEEEEAPFDWEAYESGNKEKSESALAMEKMYEDTLVTSVEHQVVTGKVISMSDRDVIIDIGSKSEGVVSLNEFRYNPDLKAGDSVEVLVDKQEDKLGQLVRPRPCC